MSGDLYDQAGNMTTLQSGDTAKYDAWNRLVQVENASGIVEKYEYDAAGRRVQVFSSFSGTGENTTATVEDDYYVGQQIVETHTTTGYNLEDKEGTAAGGYQTIWSPRYIDAPILRDTLNTAGTAIVTAERVLYLADANYNVTGLVKYDSGSSEWNVVERYTYTPYGEVTYRDADWDAYATQESQFANTTLYTGRELRTETGLYYYRARFYDAALERFVNRDPIRANFSLYRYSLNNPVRFTDPRGLATRDKVAGKEIFYTCRCGWVDTKHLGDFGILRAVLNEDNSALQSKIRTGYKVTVDIHTTVGAWGHDYIISDGLSRDEKVSAALAILHEAALGHEQSQQWSNGAAWVGTWLLSWVGVYGSAGATGFSEEDLPSHELGFYMNLLNWTPEKILEECGALSTEDSLAVWDDGGRINTGNKTFRPEYKSSVSNTAKCKCAGKEAWPDFASTVEPAMRGKTWNDNWSKDKTSMQQADEMVGPALPTRPQR